MRRMFRSSSFVDSNESGARLAVECVHLPARRDLVPSFVNVSAQEWL